MFTINFDDSSDWCCSFSLIYGSKVISIFFWNYFQRNIGMISNFECINISILFRFNSFGSINMDWSNYYWNECFSFNSNWFSIFRWSFNIILSIYCNNWCRFCANFFNFILKDWSICFWNRFKRDVSLISNFKCINFFILSYVDFSFDSIWFFYLLNWNVNIISDHNLLMSFISWLIKVSINIDCSRLNSLFSNSNWFINEDWFVFFWNNFQWNIGFFSNFQNIDFFIGSFRLNESFVLRSRSRVYWNVDFFINDYRGNFLILYWSKMLIIDFNNNFTWWSYILCRFNFMSKYLSINFWYNN